MHAGDTEECQVNCQISVLTSQQGTIFTQVKKQSLRHNCHSEILHHGVQVLPRIPILSYTPNIALFSFQRSITLGGGRVTPYMEQSGNTYGWERKRMNLSHTRSSSQGVLHQPLTQKETSAGQLPGPISPCLPPKRLPAIALVSPCNTARAL